MTFSYYFEFFVYGHNFLSVAITFCRGMINIKIKKKIVPALMARVWCQCMGYDCINFDYRPLANAFSSAIDVIGTTIAATVKAKFGSNAIPFGLNYRIYYPERWGFDFDA